MRALKILSKIYTIFSRSLYNDFIDHSLQNSRKDV